VSVAYELHTSDAKTSTGRRSVDLDEGTVRVLRTWREVRVAECGGAHGALAPDRLVFARRDGAPVHPDTFSKLFDRLVARAGLPVLSLHDLRHTHATLLLAAGVPVKVVSERLGHASPAFTMATYQHLLPGMQAEAAATFARLVDEGGPPER
jgi:integrase